MAENGGKSAELPRDDAPAQGIKRVVTDHGNKAQRLLRVDQIYSRKDRQVHFVKTAKTTSKADRFSKTAMVVRRIITSKGIVGDTEIDLKSPHLERLLKEFYAGVTGYKLNKSPPIASPKLLFWAKSFLYQTKEAEKQKQAPDQSLVNDIGTALRYVHEDFEEQISSHASLLAQNEITFELLWTIFPPKEILLAPNHGLLNQDQVMRLESSSYGRHEDGSEYFIADGYIITHDGQDFGRGNFWIVIENFEGAKKLQNLAVYPLKYHPDHEKLRQQLIARGKQFVSLLKKPVCQEHIFQFGIKEGKIIVKGEYKRERTSAEGRFMADPEAYRLHKSGSALCGPYVNADGYKAKEDMTDPDYLVCAHWINGFSLSHKVWCQVAVIGLTETHWNRNAFQKLVIDEDRRDLIHGLVKAHRNDESAFDDIIMDKGQGLVGLLSGAPGVGKTLTAEAVAEVTQRPLYVVSTGELGIEADTVDQRLEEILDITRRWGCVLLMDEADVFLAARGTDLARDSLVSIFLRRLEYFRGVCILTTNRKSEIDPAFQSRIHFTIHYPSHDEASRRLIWSNFLNTTGKSTEMAHVTDAEIAQLSRHILNGRQIKNIVACAVSLSRERERPITAAEIEKLIGILIN